MNKVSDLESFLDSVSSFFRRGCLVVYFPPHLVVYFPPHSVLVQKGMDVDYQGHRLWTNDTDGKGLGPLYPSYTSINGGFASGPVLFDNVLSGCPISLHIHGLWSSLCAFH